MGQMEHAENAEPRLDYCQSNFEIDRLLNQRQYVAAGANLNPEWNFEEHIIFRKKKQQQQQQQKYYRLATVVFEPSIQKEAHKTAKLILHRCDVKIHRTHRYLTDQTTILRTLSSSYTSFVGKNTSSMNLFSFALPILSRLLSHITGKPVCVL